MNRKSLADQFLSQGMAPWKTFVLEAHADGDPAEFLADVFGERNVVGTDDRHLHRVACPAVAFTVDHLEPRFWSFHCSDNISEARACLKAAVAHRRDLDFVWLPSAHLRLVERRTPPNWIKTDFRGGLTLPHAEVRDLSVTVRGRAARHLLELILGDPEFPHAVSVSQLGVDIEEPDVGRVAEAVNRLAVFVAKGDSFSLHQDVVHGVVARYRRLVEAAERLAVGFQPLGDEEEDGEPRGARLHGGPIELHFSRSLADVDLFLAHLLSSREPFRLWGMVSEQSADHREVEAVDLHVGQRFRLEVSPNYLRLHLRPGGCGNTVARLVSNLQHHVDGGLFATDPFLQENIAPRPSAA